MELTTFVRKPFTVEAVEVTEENIADIAEFVGTLRHKDDGSPFIQVDKRLVPNIFRVYPGFWMTKMNDNIRCYSKRIFNEQFVEITPVVQRYLDQMNKKPEKQETGPVLGDFGRIVGEVVVSAPAGESGE